MATDHSHNSLTAAADDVGVDSPNSRRPAAWASVVRGSSEQISSPSATAVSAAPGSSSPPPGQASGSDNSLDESSGREAHPESSDANGEGNAGGPRRPAWNIPSNGVVDKGSVMGVDVSWPALSESIRPVPRSLSDSVRPGSDLPASSSQAPIISTPPRRQANANFAPNSTTTTRPRSRNRGGGGGGGGGGSPSASGPSQNKFSRPSTAPPPPPPPPFPIFGLPYELIPSILNTPVRGTRPVGGVEGSQLHMGNDNASPRNTSRRGNYGPRPRGDGPYQSNHGGWRDQDRRDVHLPPQYVPPPPLPPPPLGYMPSPPPPGAPPFMVPPPVRLIPGQMGFDMASPYIYVPTVHPETFGVMPIVPPSPPPIPYPSANANPLSNLIVSQIDYYFSDINLMTDNFLRSKMDDHGWVPISLIASFPRVHLLTQDIPLILESLRYSTIVEVQGENVRRLHEWDKWLNTSASTPENVLATSLQETSLDGTTTNENGNIDTQVEMAYGRVFAEELTGPSRLGHGDDSVEEVHSISV